MFLDGCVCIQKVSWQAFYYKKKIQQDSDGLLQVNAQVENHMVLPTKIIVHYMQRFASLKGCRDNTGEINCLYNVLFYTQIDT